MTKAGEAWAFIDRAMSAETDDCILWPFFVNPDTGYAMGKYDGRSGNLHRVVCLKTHGQPPSPKHHAAHSCHVRHCINRRHISWQTPSENMLGKRANGTASRANSWGRKGKFNPEQVVAIRASDATLAVLAEQFECTIKTIRSVQNGETYADIP